MKQLNEPKLLHEDDKRSTDDKLEKKNLKIKMTRHSI